MRNIFDDENESFAPVPPSSTPTALLTATNDEATLCRYSAHVAGLINDPYIHHFLPPTRLHDRPVKDPLINRGTFLRVASIDHAISSMLSDGIETQVLSLGAGFDTRFFNFQNFSNLVRYVEVDFEEVISRKQHVIQHHSLPSPAFISADMEVNFVDMTLPKILALLDIQIRTVVIAECSLMYMRDECVKSMFSSLSSTFKSAHLIVFEPLYIGDRFGMVMAKNLSERGLPTECFVKYPTADSYESRILSCGWKNTKLITMAEMSRNPDYTTMYQLVNWSCDLLCVDYLQKLRLTSTKNGP